MKEPLPFNKPPRRGNSRAERRGFERKMQVSRLWIHKEMISVDQFVFASALNIPLFRIVPIDSSYSQFGKFLDWAGSR